MRIPALREPVALVHLALIGVAVTEPDAYGLRIWDALERSAPDLLPAEKGALYLALHRLENQGLLRSHETTQPVRRGTPKRRYYQLTRQGREALEHLFSTWDRLMSIKHVG